jgi:hypothetical protein
MSDDYAEMVVEAAGVERARAADGRRLVRFTVRAISSPAGEMRPEEAAPAEYDERATLAAVQQIESRAVDRAALIAFGRGLANLLLPPAAPGAGTGVRELFAASLAQAAAERQGLRLRLRLPPPLAALPWEFLYLDRTGGGALDGFLALDPRLAIVRHEPLAAAVPPPPTPGPVKVVVALASPADMAPVDLARNRRAIEGAIGAAPGVETQFLEDATLEDVRSALMGAEVFHFTGHGALVERQAADGSVAGVGTIALDDQRVDAEALGVNMRGAGVRLAVLGGCETGRRDGQSIWSGVAPGLIRAEVPAVVAYQLTVSEEGARAFNGAFYTALVGGAPIERALAAGRLAVFNQDQQGPEWGVAVLYMRAADGRLFAGAAEPAVRDAARKTLNATYNLRVGELAGGEIVGVRIGVVKDAGGAAEINATANVEAEKITGGSQTGVSIDEV